MIVENSPRDLQFVWHDFVGNKFSNKIIIDIGAGLGFSKKRLSINGNKVTTTDINRNLMNNVDIVDWTDKIKGSWDLVTAFDVIEHSPRPFEFVSYLANLSNNFVFITTPNKVKYNTDWHFTSEELISICGKVGKLSEFFIRIRGSKDIIYKVSLGDFIKSDCDYFGLLIDVK